ncbi:hypothetical protein ACHAWC_009945 [Mediolabrus comicus]
MSATETEPAGYGCVTVTKTPQSPAKGSTISLRSLFDALPKFCAGEMEMCMEDNDTFLVSDSDSVEFLPIPEEYADYENTPVKSVKEKKEKVPSPTALMQSRVVSNRRSSIIRATTCNK